MWVTTAPRAAAPSRVPKEPTTTRRSAIVLVGNIGYFQSKFHAKYGWREQGAFSLGSCLPCIPGYYCALGTATPSGCPDGSYLVGDQCEACTKGSFCNSNSVSPQPCPIGTYGTVTGGSTVDSVCQSCPMGSYCDLGGMTAPVPCSPGSYGPYTSGQTAACVQCPKGSYCGSASITPIPCQSGTWYSI